MCKTKPPRHALTTRSYLSEGVGHVGEPLTHQVRRATRSKQLEERNEVRDADGAVICLGNDVLQPQYGTRNVHGCVNPLGLHTAHSTQQAKPGLARTLIATASSRPISQPNVVSASTSPSPDTV